MRNIIIYLVILIIGVGVGAGGIIYLEPSLLSKTPAPVVESIPYNAAKAVPITETNIESNLANSSHYIRFDLQFSVAPPALISAGGSATAAAGGTGTGSAALDAKIRNAMINLARSTTYGQLTTSGGVSTFKLLVKEVLQSIFGPGTIGPIYFPNLITQ